MEICDVPTEFDDIHTTENQPRLNVIKPERNDSFARYVPVEITTIAPRGFNRIEYLIDGNFVKLDSNPTGTILNLPTWVTIGQHTLTVRSFDDIDNSATINININITVPGQVGGFAVTNPFNNQTIEKVNSNYTIVLENNNATNYRSVSLRAQNIWTGQMFIIQETTSPSGLTTVDWTLPDEGEYLLSAQATMLSGETVDTTPVKVFVKNAVSPNPALEATTP